MKQIPFFVLLMLVAGIISAQTNLSGTINSDSTLDLAGNPYTIVGNLIIAEGATLTVNNGVTVKFDADKRLYIYGNMNATGATFTSSSATPARGDWTFIQIGTGASNSTANLVNCQLQYGDYLYVTNNATLILDGTNVSEFFNYGLYVAGGGTIDLQSSTISANPWPIWFFGPADFTIDNLSSLSGNDIDAVRIAYYTLNDTIFLPKLPDPYPNEVPYYFANSYTVGTLGVLEVEEGNILKFSASSSLLVDGALIANAGIGDSIRFTSYRDDNWGGDTNDDGSATAPTYGNWYGVQFRDLCNDGASVMRRCNVRFAGSSNRGGVDMINASPTIDLCKFEINYFGVTMHEASNPVFTNNMIGSSQKTPIAMSFEANPTFSNNSFSFSDNEYDAIGLFGGTMTQSANLPVRSVTSIPNITYVLLSALTIPTGISLTIQPSIVIKPLSYSYDIIVNGSLIADGGSAAGMITLTSVKDDNYGNPGDTNRDGSQTAPSINDCGGVIFASGSTGTLNFMRIQNAETYNYWLNGYYLKGAVLAINASPTVTNCEIKDVYYGIMCYYTSNPVISNNSITNAMYTPIAISASADPTFSGNTFVNAGWTALGLIEGNVSTNGTIKKRNVAGYTNITYVLLDNLFIDNGTNVNVEADVVIKMNTSKRIEVNGGFRADGTTADNVIFTSLKDDNAGNPMDTNGDGSASTPAPNDWQCIKFNPTSNDGYSVFNNTRLEFGGSSSTYAAPIIYDNASGTLQNTVITNSGNYGIKSDGASLPVITNVSIESCTNDPIAMSLKSDPVFTNISFIANGSKAIKILEGTLSSDATLEKRDVAGISNIAYKVERLTISTGATLTLDPGVVIKFPGVYAAYSDRIMVQGALIAAGTPTEKIIFTSFRDDSAGGDSNNDGNTTSPLAGDWDGIDFFGTSNDALNELSYCEFRYGGSGPYYYSSFGTLEDEGAVKVKDAYVLVNNCLFQQCKGAAVGVYGSANPMVSNCEMFNIGNEPIYMAMFSSPVFVNNTALNVGRMAIGIKQETFSQNATIPQRNFAGYTNISYYLHGTLTVNSGTTIDVPAGTVFKKYNYDSFIVDGRLDLNGTQAKPVVITDYRDDAFGNPADMNQDGNATTPPVSYSSTIVRFNDISNDASVIRHAILRYAQYGVRLASASPDINNCKLEYLNYGVELNGVSQPELDSCLFNNLKFSPLITSLVSFPASILNNVISGTTYKAIEILTETLAQDVTLPKRDFGGINNIPYLFKTYTIGTGATMTIHPGVVCKFYNSGYINVKKGFIAEGGPTPDSTIVFTHIRDDFFGDDTNADSSLSAPYRAAWGGIRFENEALDPLSRLRHCIFRYSGYSSSYGAVTAISASPTVSNCSFSENYYAFIASGAANPVINYCDFFENTYDGLWNKDESFVINAEYNWWGDTSGPTHSGNPAGTGEVVSDAVDYIPWLTMPNNPIMGDVSLNDIIQAYDGSLVLQHVVAPFLTPTQQIVADVSGAAGITAYDASLILQYVVGLIDLFPAEASGKMMPMTEVSDVRLEIGSVSGLPGEVVIVPLMISNVSELFSMQAELNYNPQLLGLKSVDFEIQGVQAIANTDESGKISLAFAGTEAQAQDKLLAWLSFMIRPEVAGISASQINAVSVLANEKDVTLFAHSGKVSVLSTTPLDAAITASTQLHPVYPNPAAEEVHIDFSLLGNPSPVQISVYSLQGKEVARLVDTILLPGDHNILWDASGMPAGYYLVRMQTKDYMHAQRILLLR